MRYNAIIVLEEKWAVMMICLVTWIYFGVYWINTSRTGPSETKGTVKCCFSLKCQVELNMKSKFFLTDIYISGPFVTSWKFWHLPGIFSAIYFSLRPFMHSLECQPVKTTLLPQEGVIIRIILKVGMYYWFTKSWPYFWPKHAALYFSKPIFRQWPISRKTG